VDMGLRVNPKVSKDKFSGRQIMQRAHIISGTDLGCMGVVQQKMDEDVFH
jgi:hypothetical protein